MLQVSVKNGLNKYCHYSMFLLDLNLLIAWISLIAVGTTDCIDDSSLRLMRILLLIIESCLYFVFVFGKDLMPLTEEINAGSMPSDLERLT